MAPGDSNVPSRPRRDSTQPEKREMEVASKRSFHNLRALFKLPSRVSTPNIPKDALKPNRDRQEPMGNQVLPAQQHRLLGPISPTRERRSIPPTTSMPNVRAPRNSISAIPLPQAGRNISLPEPLSTARISRPNYSRPNPGSLRHFHTMNPNNVATPRRTSINSMYIPEGGQPPPVLTSRPVFTDITRRINSPQLNSPKPGLGARNLTLGTLAYTAAPTTSTYQQTSPPRPVFTNGSRPRHKAERSLSFLNQENAPSPFRQGRDKPVSSSQSRRNSVASVHNFATTVSSLLRASNSTTALSHPETPPKAVFTTNPRCIYTAQPHAYWAGRFMSLHDQYHTQMLITTVRDDTLLQSFLKPMTTASRLRQQEYANNEAAPTTTARTTSPTFAIEIDELRRCKRVFYTLQSLCVTAEAKRSLWAFQLRFARDRKMEACLPDGGSMEDIKEKIIRPWTKLANRRKGSTTPGSLGETF